jgi:hypothetical protein
MIMEGGDEDKEVDVTMQHNDELIRTENDQFMEDNVILNKYKIKSLYLFKKLLFLQK